MVNSWTGKHWMTGQTIQVKVEGSIIQDIQPSDQPSEYGIAPGLIDVQVNGIGGFNLNGADMTADTVRAAVRELHKGGVTRFCPTVTTRPKERILHCVRTIAEACEAYPEVAHAVIGIHVEGPFISDEEGPRGAHNRAWIRDPDWDEFLEWQAASGGRIRMVTLAPERNGAIAFIERLREHGAIAAIGHCNATEEQIGMAVRAGATMSTHLGNGSHPLIRRHPNYIWAQLAEDQLWAGLIPDGFHLPMSTLKSMIRVKGRKAVLVSDAVALAGMPPGRYYGDNGDRAVVLEPNGFLHMASAPDILAGSALQLHAGIQNIAAAGICSLGEAIRMATLHPAELFGLDRTGVGKLEPHAPADFIIYRKQPSGGWSIIETVSAGQPVYRVE